MARSVLVICGLALSLTGCAFELMSRDDTIDDTDTTQTSGTNGTGAGSTGGVPNGQPEPLDGEWVNATSNLAGTETECGALTRVVAKPNEDLLIAGIALRGLWASDDGGDRWEPLGTGDDSDEIKNRPTLLVFDPDDDETFWESGIYVGPGVFKTTDNGKTMTQQGDVAHVDGVGIDFSDPDRQTLLAGSHEVSNVLRLSSDGGETWEEIGERLPEGNCTMPLVLSSEVFLLGCSDYGEGFKGILRSTDGGENWDEVDELGGGQPEPLQASDGSIYWSYHTGAGLVRSTDDGKTWDVVDEGHVRSQPREMKDGRLAALGVNGLIVSSDEGETWEAASPAYPEFPAPVSGFTYSEHQKAFFIWYQICGETVVVEDETIMRFDYE